MNYGNIPQSPASFYDPISPGSSRRSSQLSTITSDGAVNDMGFSPPSSQLLSSHLARLQQYSYYNNNQMNNSQYFNLNNMLENQMGAQQNLGAMYNQHPQQAHPFNNPQSFYGNMPYHAASSSGDRRMSEPISKSRNVENESQVQNMTPRPRSTTPTKSLEMLLEAPIKSQKKVTKNKQGKPEEHPNREVVLDTLNSGEKIENKLVIPDDMLSYLAQVDSVETAVVSEKPLIEGDELIVDQLMTSIDIDKLKEEDLLLFLNEVDGEPEKSKPEEEDMSNDNFSNRHKNNSDNKDDDQDEDTKKVSHNTSNASEISSDDSHTQQRENHSNSSEINNNISSNSDNVDSHNCKEETSKLLYKTHASIYILSMET